MSENIWQPGIDVTVCTGCGDCVVSCPAGALALAGRVAVLVKPDACTYCADCEAVCPVGAIDLPYQIVLEARQPGNFATL